MPSARPPDTPSGDSAIAGTDSFGTIVMAGRRLEIRRASSAARSAKIRPARPRP